MVPSIASARDEIGVRAARHLDTTFRAMMRPPAAEHQPGFIRVITGEPHPMGNAAIVSNPNDPAVRQAAAVPLRESGLPAIVLFTEGVTAEAAKTLEAMGFADQGAMPAMAVDIDAMGNTALPAGSRGRASAPAAKAARGPARWPRDTHSRSAWRGSSLRTRWAPTWRPTPGSSSSRCSGTASRSRHRCSCWRMAWPASIASRRSPPTGTRLGAHATAQALREAQRLGYRVGVLQSSPDGHSVYLKLGFLDLAEIPMFVRMPG